MQIEKYNHETERLHAQIKVDIEGEAYVDTKYLSILSGPGNFDKTRLKNIGKFVSLYLYRPVPHSSDPLSRNFECKVGHSD